MLAKIKEFIRVHSFLAASILFGVVILVVALVVVIVGVSKKPTNPEGGENPSGDVTIDYSLSTEGNEAITQAMVEYHTALANNDVDTIKKYLLYVNDNELDNIAVKSQYIENYNDITCYIQKGHEENSYFVYVSYMLKFNDYDTEVPGLIGVYYCPDESGQYHIYRKTDMSPEVLENFYVCYMQQEVQDLYNAVDHKYNEAVDGDEEVKNFMDNLNTLVKEEMVKLIAIREASEEATNPEPETPAEPDETPTTDKVTANTTVNVRSSDSETADKLGQVQGGTELTRLENKVNGWSKVEYQGKEGYIKTEFLTPVGGDNQSTETTTTGNKTVRVKENVNIRKSASEEGDRLALAYEGENLELIEKMSNGWTKIKYNGQEAYVKSDYVE